MITKEEIRKSLIAERNDIDPVSKMRRDKKISDNIINSSCFQNANQVLVFASTGSEFDTSYIIEKCRISNKKVYYPKCLDKKGRMEFFLVNDIHDLKLGMYGIYEPKEDCETYSFQDGDIVIVPALSVDKVFIRIGYGKGYYDRFLKEFHGKSICPCYDEMRTDRLPSDEFDISVDFVATETGFYQKEVIL